MKTFFSSSLKLNEKKSLEPTIDCGKFSGFGEVLPKSCGALGSHTDCAIKLSAGKS